MAIVNVLARPLASGFHVDNPDPNPVARRQVPAHASWTNLNFGHEIHINDSGFDSHALFLCDIICRCTLRACARTSYAVDR